MNIAAAGITLLELAIDGEEGLARRAPVTVVDAAPSARLAGLIDFYGVTHKPVAEHHHQRQRRIPENMERGSVTFDCLARD
jgi:hypothetical protein